MAGRKKQPELTAEEKLQQALVPEAEEPYKVPDNWCWVRLKILSDFERGITFPASAKEKIANESNIPCIRTANIQEELEIDDLIYVDKKYMKENENKLIRVNDIIMSSANSRELVGKVSYVNYVSEPMTFGGFVIVIRSQYIFSKFLFYFLRLEFLFGHFMGKSTQTTNIANINTANLGNYAFPLPPLAEQQRIVERIETLFAKLDEAKEKLQNTLDIFEIRKAAILHKAFTGELTANWRKQHDLTLDSWKEKTLGEVANSQYGYTESATDEAIGPKFLRITDIQNGFVNWDEVPYCKISDKELDKYVLSVDDIVIARTGATTGKSYLIKDKINSVFASYLIRLKLKTKNVLADFIYQYMQSQFYWTQITDFSKGIAQPGVNAQKLKEIKFNLPTLDEQTEIVRIIDNLFAKEQQAHSIAQNALAKIDLIKKSILARAFRGQLATNNPADEPAIELLKKVL